jgi:hypothetical protein
MTKLRKYLSRLFWKDWQIIIITGKNGALWVGTIDPKKEIIDMSKKPITTISKFDYFSK